MTACLPTSANRNRLSGVTETAEKIHEFYNRPRIQAIETPAPNLVTLQQSDVLGNSTASGVSVISRYAEKCLLQSSDLALQAINNHFPNLNNPFSAI
ncbi:hypothetical protein ACTXT7_005731 [Hymenolepis weldensis]